MTNTNIITVFLQKWIFPVIKYGMWGGDKNILCKLRLQIIYSSGSGQNPIAVVCYLYPQGVAPG